MKIFFLILLSCLLNVNLFAQGKDSIFVGRNDSLNIAIQDSTSFIDTSISKKRYDVDTVIYASASDSLFFFINEKKMELYGSGDLKYKDTELKSSKINVNFATSNVDASGVPSDTAEGKYDGTPILSEGGEVYDGFKMRYNFKTTRGIISAASSKLDDAIYSGEKINKVDKDTYFIQDGIYTTCDAKPPHYYFSASEMKVIQKKILIAKWIWLYFGGVPFPIPVPFAVFPIQSGRRSGIIPPVFGSDPNYGYYFSRFGYFWAINDYLDLRLTADYYTRGRWGIDGRFRYAKRYNFTGELNGGYKFLSNGESTDPNHSLSKEWNLSWRHNQTITPTMRFDANLQFISGKNYIQNTSFNLNEALTSNIISNVTLFKSWEESGNSFSLSYSRNQDLQTGNISEVLPNANFTVAQSYPFRKKNSIGDQKWYELIGYNYSGQFENTRNKANGDLTIHGGIQHNISVGASPKFGHISISPSLRYTEKWYNKRTKLVDAGVGSTGTDSILTRDIHAINMVRTFSVGASASTKFYGIFQPNTLGIEAIRHTVIPSISYSYQPDFSKPGWGYYDSYTDSKGNVVRYDKFQREVFGGVSSGESQSISFSVGNIFEMKTIADPTDTTSQQKKIQLLNLTASTSYNFAADSLKLSNLSLNYRTQIGQYLNLSGSSSFTPYDYSTTSSKINKFLINEGKGFLRLQNLSFSVSTSLSGDKIKSSESNKLEDTYGDNSQYNNDYNSVNGNNYQGIYDTREPDFSIPWSVSLSYNYNLSKPTPLNMTEYSNVSGSLDFNLTKNWKFTVSGSYDIQNKQFAAPQIRISRDLHAWIMNFTWNPLGTYRGYYLEIRVKAPQLQDLKLTKRDQFYDGK